MYLFVNGFIGEFFFKSRLFECSIMKSLTVVSVLVRRRMRCDEMSEVDYSRAPPREVD